MRWTRKTSALHQLLLRICFPPPGIAGNEVAQSKQLRLLCLLAGLQLRSTSAAMQIEPDSVLRPLKRCS